MIHFSIVKQFYPLESSLFTVCTGKDAFIKHIFKTVADKYLFGRSQAFRTFLGKMTYLLPVVLKSFAIKMISTWRKVVSSVMRYQMVKIQ